MTKITMRALTLLLLLAPGACTAASSNAAPADPLALDAVERVILLIADGTGTA